MKKSIFPIIVVLLVFPFFDFPDKSLGERSFFFCEESTGLLSGLLPPYPFLRNPAQIPCPGRCSAPDMESRALASWTCRLISLPAKIPARDSVLGVARPCCLFLLSSARSGAVLIFVST
jgi:hypothetical protein